MSRPRWRGSKLSTIRNGHPAAPGGLQCSLAHWAYFALLRPQGARFVRPPPLPHPQFAMVVLHLRTVPSSAARCFASADFASLCVLEASAASRPPMKAELPCLLGLLRPVSATGGGLRAPPPVSAKILRIFGRGNCKEAIFALENGIFRRKNRPVPAVHAAGDD